MYGERTTTLEAKNRTRLMLQLWQLQNNPDLDMPIWQ